MQPLGVPKNDDKNPNSPWEMIIATFNHQRRFDVVECECEICDFKEDFIVGLSSLMNGTPWSFFIGDD